MPGQNNFKVPYLYNIHWDRQRIAVKVSFQIFIVWSMFPFMPLLFEAFDVRPPHGIFPIETSESSWTVELIPIIYWTPVEENWTAFWAAEFGAEVWTEILPKILSVVGTEIRIEIGTIFLATWLKVEQCVSHAEYSVARHVEPSENVILKTLECFIA